MAEAIKRGKRSEMSPDESIDLSAGFMPKNTPAASPTESSALTQKSPTDEQPAFMADLPAAIEQLKAWAQVGKLIRYESGTLLSAINFMARLLLGSDGSFMVRGAPEYGAVGMCGCIYPSHVEYVRVCREENYVAVILRRLDGSNCIVFDDNGRLEELWRSEPATPLKN